MHALYFMNQCKNGKQSEKHSAEFHHKIMCMTENKEHKDKLPKNLNYA